VPFHGQALPDNKKSMDIDLMISTKDLFNRGARLLGREVVSAETYARLQSRSDELNDLRRQSRGLELILRLSPEAAVTVLHYLPQARSQFRQDLFALSEVNFKQGGFFVEFGATNGVDISNTWLMEKQFGWRGILAEPGRVWHESLRQNRECAVDRRCVWSKTGATVEFAEVSSNPDLSTVRSFTDDDVHKTARGEHVAYDVETVSLNDLLAQHDAPRRIDYLSIDTEGSEFAILAAFDFAAYEIGVLTVEHNFGPNREKTKALLEAHGYVRKWEELSYVDDWYVRR
jgi:FkbM family methyltransferase